MFLNKNFFNIAIVVLTAMLLQLIPSNTKAEGYGLPYFINFSPKDYRQESQNYSITQDSKGLMYFGNLSGIMQFDNSEWLFTPYSGRPIMCAGKNNEVYIGGYNRLSKLEFIDGLLKLENIPLPEEMTLGQIQKVIVRENDVIFCGSNSIIKYMNDSIEVILNTNQIIRVFQAGEDVYVSLPEHGLFKLKDNNIVPSMFNEFFVGKIVIDVKIFDNGVLLIKTLKENGFYKTNGNKLEYFNTDANVFIKDNEYVKSSILSNGNIITGTVYGGIVCIDSLGNYMFSLNKRNGLLDNHITDLFIDKDNGLWITSYNGIACIQSPSNFSYINDTYGLYGAIGTIARYNNNMYFGTTQGIYYKNNALNYDSELHVFTDEKQYYKIPNIITETQSLKEINKALYLASSNGIYRIYSPDKVEKIIDGFYRDFLESSVFDNIIYVSGKDGLMLMRQTNNSIQ